MKKTIMLIAVAGLIAAGCASKNTGGTSDNQTAPQTGSGEWNYGTNAPSGNTGTSDMGGSQNNLNNQPNSNTQPNGNTKPDDNTQPPNNPGQGY